MNPEWHLGLQARAVSRRFILTQFYVTDAVINNGEGLVDTRTQNLLFLEPGVLWTPTWGDWEPHISAAATQTGLRSRKDDEIPDDPEGEVGLSVKVPGLAGRLRLGPHVSLNARQHEEWDEKLRIAGVYDQESFKGTFRVLSVGLSTISGDEAPALQSEARALQLNLSVSFRSTFDPYVSRNSELDASK